TTRAWLRRTLVVAFILTASSACASDKTTGTAGYTGPGQTVTGNYLAGRFAQARKDVPGATKFLGAVLKMTPTSPEVLRRIFILMVAEGRMKEATGLAARLLDVNSKAPIANLLLVAAAIKDGRYEEALERLKTLPDNGLNTLMSPIVKSWALFGLGKGADVALKALEPLLKRNGAEPLYRLHGALILELSGRTKEAETFFIKAVEIQGGLSFRLAELFGGFYERSGQIKKAQALYRQFSQDNPGSQLRAHRAARRKIEPVPPRDVVDTVTGVAEGLFGLASSLRQQNARETALVFGRIGLYLRPDFPVMQILIADILDSTGRLESANKIYLSIRTSSLFSWQGRLRVALNLDDMGRTDEAVARLRAMAVERPKDPNILIRLGDILRSRERFKEAIEVYNQAESRIGKPSRRYWNLFYARGISLEQTRQWAKAEADFLESLKIRPDQPFVLNYLGYSWIDQGMNLDRAMKMIEKAVSLRPNDGYIVDSLGWAHYRLKSYDLAVSELERAVELRPEDSVINDHLGDAYWRVGRRNEARFQWRRSLGLKPDPERVGAIESKIDKGLPKTKAAANGDG
ncbi:MAG TPA: tetratricopeptide repeat protein, partial [Rhodospirillales bacterium]|nr:tetratricopeptide repeat protein [Rhodospirillales bacterium]